MAISSGTCLVSPLYLPCGSPRGSPQARLRWLHWLDSNPQSCSGPYSDRHVSMQVVYRAVASEIVIHHGPVQPRSHITPLAAAPQSDTQLNEIVRCRHLSMSYVLTNVLR